MRTLASAVTLLTLVILTVASGRAAAQQLPEHRDGLYLRAQLGGGGARASTELFGFDVDFTGGAAGLNLEAGIAVSPRLILFGKLYGLTVPDYDVEEYDALVKDVR